MTRPDKRTDRRRAALAAGVAVLACLSAPAFAQSLNLRGNVEDEQKVLSPLERRKLKDQSTALSQSDADKAKAKAEKDAQNKVYLPESEGAVSPDELEESRPDGADPTRPKAPRLPVSARKREAENEALAEEQAAVKKRRTATRDEPQDILTGTVRAPSVPSDDEERNTRAKTDNARTEAIEGLDRTADEDPYAPTGLRLGTFTLTPSLETGLTVTDNATSSTVKQRGTFWETTARVNAVSGWTRHQAQLNAYVTWREATSGPGQSEPDAGLDATLRLDLIDNHALTAKAGYKIKREDAESPVPLPATAGRPLLQTFEGSVALEKTEGKLRYGLTGALTREAYGDADLTGGGTLSQKDRNSSLATATLRLGYEVSPALVPFVEGEYGRRFYDNTRDAAGYQRSADRIALRAGVEVSMGEKLTGELAAGWQQEKADDRRLPAISGLSLMANLNWSPQRGTQVSLTGETSVEGTTTPGDSGSLLHSATLAIEHRLRANLTANAQFSASLRDYVTAAGGQDITMAGQLGFTWWLNRNLGLTTRVRHERLTSTLPNRDTVTNSVFVGMKWQH
ncbi:MAG: outer membrane beta-barrel protein [Notoacmeibacter sp.]|nr:outer membrane beta-barrel protein [Notoacmeibacter sp.]MCC0032856.1 outer membrane beta-barrel protein [Brucellaceae bacterium]